MSVKAALKQRPKDAEPVIRAELQQLEDKQVWHPVHRKCLTKSQRMAVLRSSMFMKDKYTAEGAFAKFKERLVAGGDGQDKSLYTDLLSPTAATSSVFTVAAIAAWEQGAVLVVDIGGAFLNADLSGTGVIVHMKLDPTMTIVPEYAEFVEEDGSLTVQLDKALYGTVEAARL